MTIKDVSERNYQALKQAAINVRAYENSDLSGHVIEMLDALAASYCLDLIEVAPDGLVRLQAALKQVNALRNVFANEGADVPKI